MSTWTPAAGIRVHARLLRPPGRSRGVVVMVHGLGVSAASLGPLAELIAEDSTTLVCDLPGFGLSDAERVWSTSEVADAVETVLERRGLGRVTLIGHSWGCHVATLLAGRHPGRVGALVLLSPAFDRRPGGGAALVARLALDAPMERPSLVAGGVRDYLRAGPRRVLSTLRDAGRIRLEERVGQVVAPVLIVRGGRDPLTTARWARRLAAAAPRGRVAVVPRAAHGLGHDAPHAVAAAISAFLAVQPHRPRMSAVAAGGPAHPEPVSAIRWSDPVNPADRPDDPGGRAPEEASMSVHLTPGDIADLLEVEPHVVERAADEVGVPVYQGRIDRVLLTGALIAAEHHLAPLARERLVRDGDIGTT